MIRKSLMLIRKVSMDQLKWLTNQGYFRHFTLSAGAPSNTLFFFFSFMVPVPNDDGFRNVAIPIKLTQTGPSVTVRNAIFNIKPN